MRFEILLAFALAATASAASLSSLPAGVVSVAAMKEYIATTDAELTFVGAPIGELGINPLLTTVTVCSTAAGNLCSGPCTVLTGSARCFETPDTACLSATTNIAFCNQAKCKGKCTPLSSCNKYLGDGFCYTPGTRSISLPV
ncbi:hypothetical protein R3P38DRAFT_2545534 [Favolaschia claudopus]|uniref:Uncharacterized protein n=1 Tax=Favolaschia claudopus TaxID=2862362 RepID=A0AAW0AMD3_9AGAR